MAAGRPDAPPALHGQDFSIKTENNELVIELPNDYTQMSVVDEAGNDLDLGVSIDVGEIQFDDGEGIDWGTDSDVRTEFDASVGGNGAYVVSDEINSEPRVQYRVGGRTRFVNRGLTAAGGNTRLAGNDLTRVGGTPGAGAGGVRLASTAAIQSRDAGDTADLQLLVANASDETVLGNTTGETSIDAASLVGINGNDLTEVGGTPAAAAGAIRVANNTPVQWRNSGDTDDGFIQFANDDQFYFNVNSANELIVSGSKLDLVNSKTLRLRGSDITEVGGTPAATSGAIRLANDVPITARNNADDGDVDLWKVNASDGIEAGTSVFIPTTSRLIVGDTAETNVGGAGAGFQVLGTGNDSATEMVRFDTSAGAPQMQFAKTRSGTVGTVGTAVQDGDRLIRIRAFGDDGTDLVTEAAQIEVSVDGAVAADQVPGRVIFRTATTAGALNEALRIDANQDTIVRNGDLTLDSINEGISFAGNMRSRYEAAGDQVIFRDPDAAHIVLGLATDGTGQVSVPSGNLAINGNSLTGVGGTPAASAGAIRLVNAGAIQSRNAGDTADVRLIQLDGNDILQLGGGGAGAVRFGAGSGLPLEMNGNDITQIGGTTDASAGAIRLPNNTLIQWRNAGDSGNLQLQYNANDDLSMQPNQYFMIGLPNGQIANGALNNSQGAFSYDEANNEIEINAQDSAGTNQSGVVATVSSSRRYKTSISGFAGDPKTILDLPARTFRGDVDGREQLGVIAEEAHDLGLEHLVRYQPAEGMDLTDEYLDEYGTERLIHGEMQLAVPDNIYYERGWVYHNEILREQHQRIQDLEERLAELESQFAS